MSDLLEYETTTHLTKSGQEKGIEALLARDHERYGTESRVLEDLGDGTYRIAVRGTEEQLRAANGGPGVVRNLKKVQDATIARARPVSP